MASKDVERRARELFEAAAECNSWEKQRRFLEEQCGSDVDLIERVMRLLRAREAPSGFLPDQPGEKSPKHGGAPGSGEAPGEYVGRYRIEERIGAGGMGVVYRAHDTLLERDVAIKFLPEHYAGLPRALKRFQREARAASTLNHPNICTIYDVGEHDGQPYIVMELLEGETLKERVIGEPLALDQILDYGVQIACALEASHAAGIIHRDIKPANVFVTIRGVVKVLDFGLAKLMPELAEPEQEDGGPPRRSPLDSSASTIMGTAAYMSPEQAERADLDPRTDLYSLGAVLYEMATGQLPFDDTTSALLQRAILHEKPPPPTKLKPGLPRGLEAIIVKALAKDPEARCQTAGELREALLKLGGDRAGEAGDAPFPHTPTGLDPPRHRRWRWKLAVALTGGAITVLGAWLAVGAGGWFVRGEGDVPLESLQPVLLDELPGAAEDPALSPSGNRIAVVGFDGDWNVHVHEIGSDSPPLTLTEGSSRDRFPVWSPDGERVAFLRHEDGSGSVVTVPADGGAEQYLYSGDILVSDAGGLDWSPDGGLIAFAARESEEEPWGVHFLAPETGEIVHRTKPPEGAHGDKQPAFGPGGRSFAFQRAFYSGVGDIHIGVLGEDGVERLSFENQGAFGVTWGLDESSVIYAWGSTQPRLSRLLVGGGAPLVFPGAPRGIFRPSVSRNGSRLAYTLRRETRDIWRVSLPTADSQAVANITPLATSWSKLSDPDISPDGSRIAISSNQSGSREIWVTDAGGNEFSQLTDIGGPVTGTPRWSPDGTWIAFDSRVDGVPGIYLVRPDGGELRRLTSDVSSNYVPTWSRDGEWIYFSSDRTGRNEIWKKHLNGGHAIQITTGGGFEAFEAPDGETVYYSTSMITDGVWELPADGGDAVLHEELAQVSSRLWSVGERGIYFLNTDTSPPAIEVFEYETGEVIRLVSSSNLELLGGRFVVSPDETWALGVTGTVVRGERSPSEVYIVDDFQLPG